MQKQHLADRIGKLANLSEQLGEVYIASILYVLLGAVDTNEYAEAELARICVEFAKALRRELEEA